ncbi:MAG: hypothetical protein RQ899_02440, partial [Pseudomonadales bacterium]|nr:hypothetical protein [Pseudomonadales bacterium]
MNFSRAAQVTTFISLNPAGPARRPGPRYLRCLLPLLLLVGLNLFAASAYATTYYSQGSVDPKLTASWNSIRTGGGTVPANFTIGDIFVIQNGHTLTTTSGGWTVSGSGAEIQVESGGVLSYGHDVSFPGMRILAGGEVLRTGNQLIIAANGSLIVDGSYRQTGGSGVPITIGTGATVEFRSGSFYRHHRNGNLFPIASWDPNSTVEVVLAGTAPDNIDQEFGNFIWDSPGQGSSNLNIGGTGLRIKGNFELKDTGTSGSIRLVPTALTIDGNFMQTGGRLVLTTSNATTTMTVAGNYSISGGTLEQADGSNANRSGILEVAGNLSHTGGTITETNANAGGTGTLVFNGSGTQTFASGGTVSNTINYTVNSGATLLLGSSLLGNGSSGTFTLDSGATLGIGDAAGVTTSGASGNVRVSGTRTYSTGANYIYNGSSAQVTGNGLPATVNALTVSSSAGVSLSQGLTTNGTLTLTNGALSLGANTLTVNSLISTTSGSLTGGASSNLIIGGTGASTTLPTVTLNNLTLNRANGISLGGNVTVGGTLTFTAGNVTTGVNTLAISASGGVSRTSGHVVGNFMKHVATGSTLRTFEIGSSGAYTPVALDFGNVSVAGNLTASTTAGDHPNIATSVVNGAKSVNRFWTLSNGGVTFNNYKATFTFVAGDIDAGAATASFIVGKRDAGAWSAPTVGTRTGTSTQATGMTTFGDFQIGEALAATKLTLTTQPSASAANGAAFSQQPVVQLRDALNNAVGQAGVVVTAAIASGTGTLGGTLTATTNASGVATFTNLSITGTTGDRTLQFSATGLTTATSGTVTLTAGAATQLALTAQPSSSAANGAAFLQQPVVQLRDSGGNNVSQANVEVMAAIATGGGTLGGTLAATTNASGAATFTNLAITGTAGGRTLQFSASGLTMATSDTISLTAGAATQLVLTTQPSGSVVNGAAFSQQPVVQLRDSGGNNVSQASVVVTAAIATGGGTLGGTLTATTNVSGVATFTNLSITGTAGDRTLQFSATDLTTATSNTVTVTAGTATQLALTAQPSASVANGAAFAQQPAIQLRDASNNAVSQAGVVVTAAIASGGGTLGGTLTATTNASGVATFTDLAITGTIGDRTLQFSASGLTATTSATVTVITGTATQLALTTQPSASVANGVAFAQQPVVQLRDSGGNNVSQASVVVTAAIASGGGTLGGTLTAATNALGVATFTDLSISGTAGGRTLQFSAGGLTTVSSGTVTVTAATQLTLTTQPSGSAVNGAAFAQQPVVQLRDASNNAISQAGVVVTAAIASGTGTLGGTLTATTDAMGVATFTNLAITGTIGDRTLQFSASGLTAVTSGTVTLTAGAATQLALTAQPSSGAVNGAAFSQQPVVQLRDASGNNVSQANVEVTAAIATGGGTLGGTLAVITNASGAATFTNLAITGTAGGRTLQFSASGLTMATSDTISLTAGAAAQLALATQPSGAANGTAFSQQPVVQLRDSGGNNVSQASVVVTAAIATGGGTLGGTLTATTDAMGVATFTNLSITGTAGGRTLQFSASGLTAATSGTLTLTAGAATQLALATQPLGAANGTAFSQQPVVQLRDSGGNNVSQASVVVAAAIATGGGTLGGTLTATTNASGVATFTDLSITGTIGDRTLQFSATGLTAVTSATVTLTAGAAAQLALTTQPSGNVANGVAFAQQPVVQLRDSGGNNVSQASVVVTAAIASGGGTLGGTLTAATNALGVATFTDLSISGTAGGRTLQFSAGGLTTVSSGTVTVTAATQLTLTTQPSGSAVNGAAFAQQPVVQLRDASNNAI